MQNVGMSGKLCRGLAAPAMIAHNVVEREKRRFNMMFVQRISRT
jgi:hypothetical protein